MLNFRIGDLVTRISHKHDILFKIINIDREIVYLKGVDLRLIADCGVEDLVKAHISDKDQDKKILEENVRDLNLDRSQYFYLPGKILHIDADYFCDSYFIKFLKSLYYKVYNIFFTFY